MDASDKPSPGSLVASAVVFEGGLAVVALVVGHLLHVSPLQAIDWSFYAIAQGLLATFPLVAALLAIDRLPFGLFQELDAFVRRALVPLFRGLSPVEILLISVAAGLGEEILFRGVAQPWLARVSGSVPFALYVASLLFGLAHPVSRTYVILAALIGAYLGGLLLWTENLLVPIVTHAAYDFVAIVYLLRTSPVEESAD